MYSVLTWLLAPVGGKQMATLDKAIGAEAFPSHTAGAGDLVLFHSTHLLISPGVVHGTLDFLGVPSPLRNPGFLCDTPSQCQKGMRNQIKDSWVQGP